MFQQVVEGLAEQVLFDLTSEERGKFSHGQTWGKIWKWFLEESAVDSEAKEPEAERTGLSGPGAGVCRAAHSFPQGLCFLSPWCPHRPRHWSGGFFPKTWLCRCLALSPSHLDLVELPSLPHAGTCLPWTHMQVGTPLTRVDVSNWQEFSGCQPPCLSPSSSIQSQSQAGTAGFVAPKGSESGSAGSQSSWMGIALAGEDSGKEWSFGQRATQNP